MQTVISIDTNGQMIMALKPKVHMKLKESIKHVISITSLLFSNLHCKMHSNKLAQTCLVLS